MSTADSVLLSLGAVVSVDLMGKDRRDPGTTAFGKRVAAIAMALAVALALSPQFTLWRLIELKMELLIQCVPAFLIALHSDRVTARAVWVGVVVGTLVAAGAALGGWSRVGGVHVGVIGLAFNLICVFALSAGARKQITDRG